MAPGGCIAVLLSGLVMSTCLAQSMTREEQEVTRKLFPYFCTVVQKSKPLLPTVSLAAFKNCLMRFIDTFSGG